MRFIGKKESLFVASKMRDELIYHMAKSEGNTLSYAETSTVISGISVGGKKMFELKQIENIRDGWDEIINQVKTNSFNLSKQNFIHINSIVAKDENPELGGFRTKQLFISGTKWQPTLPLLLDKDFEHHTHLWNENFDVNLKAYDIFLGSARSQFFADGNKRTAQLIMNGYLMQEGYSLFSISPENDVEYKEKLIGYYENGNKEVILEFFWKVISSVRYEY
jgi:hypothetical protein